MQLPNLPLDQIKTQAGPALRWLSRTIDTLCERPDHLQRLAIIGAGMVVYPLVVGLILIVWLGFGPRTDPAITVQQLKIMGWALLGSMGLWGLVVVTLLGTVKGLRVNGPGGVGLEVETTAGDGKGLSHAAATVINTTQMGDGYSATDGFGGGGAGTANGITP